LFQFQSGAIERSHIQAGFIVDEMFQFQSGAIERHWVRALRLHRQCCFNSNLVRLKVNDILECLHVGCTFQFQSGAIERNTLRRVCSFSDSFQFQSGAIERRRRGSTSNTASMFQFQSGAIESQSPPDGYFTGRLVSIPIWCD